MREERSPQKIYWSSSERRKIPPKKRFFALALRVLLGYTLGRACTDGLPLIANSINVNAETNPYVLNNPNLPTPEIQVAPNPPPEAQSNKEVGNEKGIAPVFTKSVQYWADSIQRWAKSKGLDPNLLALVMQIESCGNPDAVSPAGAVGLFQVMPLNFPEDVRSDFDRMKNTELNAQVATDLLAKLLEKTNGNVLLALAAYNGGNKVLENPNNPEVWPAETRRYYEWAKIYEEIKQNPNESSTLQEWLKAGGASLCATAEKRLGLTSE